MLHSRHRTLPVDIQVSAISQWIFFPDYYASPMEWVMYGDVFESILDALLPQNPLSSGFKANLYLSVSITLPQSSADTGATILIVLH